MSTLRLYVRRYGFDALIVIGAVTGVFEGALRQGSSGGPQTAVWFAAPAIALVVLPLLVRRRLPFAAPASVWVLAAALSFADGRLVGAVASAYLAGMAAAFLLGRLADDAQARIGLALVVSGAAIIVFNGPNYQPAQLIFTPLMFAMAWLAGFALRERTVQAEAAEERAAHAERERDAAVRLAVAEERTRIARELHDVVAHAMSVMVLQVGAVRHRLPEAAEEDRDALQDVEHAGRTALTEMRRLLGAMRSDSDGPELAPQPGLDSLDSLLEGVGRAGLPARLHVEGDPVPLPRAIDLSAYRIVQEGLTNALKHARASQADVTIRYGKGEVHIEVRDNGEGVSTGGDPGSGLVGVRERVKIYGGEMSAGAAPEGGFVLRTRLPLGGESS